MSEPATSRARGPSPEKTARTRAAIVRAAFESFVVQGFADSRIEDISRRAGVAKGTVYSYFATKEALFEQVLQDFIASARVGLQTADRLPGERVGDFLQRTLLPVIAALESSGRGHIARLVITESARFPALAEAYVREVHRPLVEEIRRLAGIALAEGELGDDTLVRYPELLLGSNWLGMVHNGMLSPSAPLDIGDMFARGLRLLWR